MAARVQRTIRGKACLSYPNVEKPPFYSFYFLTPVMARSGYGTTDDILLLTRRCKV